MEHEVFVPVPSEALRVTLADPARVVRCVPGLQQDADVEAVPLTGRLKVRVGGNTITYRGALRVVERDGAITYEGQGTEARGKGSAELSLTVVLTPVAEGTSLSFTGALTADGRLAEATGEARSAAAAKLLDKFVEALAALAGEPVEPDAVRAGASDDGGGEGADDGVDDGAEEPTEEGSGADAPVPPSTLEPVLDSASIEFPAPQPAVEAAHARRTMIGRSAEEVDHAPPRGRYAPVPAPEAMSAGATLRWIAPAAALALASAVVVGRALRRRR
ncbi:SRPBCC domain-containing protein [Streptomyces sp. NPDC058872]|uniref:SRPBCC domain-containing protein n=1 Tax=Streptomyces sp. NPDC058872 TaxID=3346661 RepID=UPI003674C227